MFLRFPGVRLADALGGHRKKKPSEHKVVATVLLLRNP